MSRSDRNHTRIAVVGGGFAGLWAAVSAARRLAAEKDDEASVMLISRDRYLTIRPRLYEANPEPSRIPLASVLGPAGAGFQQASASAIDPTNRRILVDDDRADPREISYQRLILATGSETIPLPIDGASEYSFNIDSLDGSRALDRHLARLGGIPADAARESVVIVGAGFTGIELATAMRDRLALHWGRQRAAAARVVLIERGQAVGPGFGKDSRPYITEALYAQRVEVRLGERIDRVRPQAVWLASGERIETRTTIITAGLRASTLARMAAGAKLDDLGRLHVNRALQVEGMAHVYATGDIARAYADDEHLAPMSCQHAILMGKVAGHNAAGELLGLAPLPYRQPDHVTCLDLGSTSALYTEGWDRHVRLAGIEAKRLKRRINTDWILPPQGDRDAIFEAVRSDLRRSNIYN
jgi:NADH dehydrogenase